NQRALVSRFRSSHHCAAASFANFGIEGHWQLTDLVWLWFRSPHFGLAARMMRTSEPPHWSAVLPDRTGGNRTIRAVSSLQYGGACVPFAARAAALALRAVTLGDPLGRSLERVAER